MWGNLVCKLWCAKLNLVECACFFQWRADQNQVSWPKLKLEHVTDTHPVRSLHSLGSNQLKDEGIEMVCNALKDSKVSKLTELLLHNIGITVAGAASVATYLAVTGELTKIG